MISWGTIFGFFVSIGLFVFAIVENTSNYMMFFTASSFLMVLGGTLAVAFASYSGRYVVSSLKELVKILIPSRVNYKTLYANVGMIITWSDTIRKADIPSLERTFNLSEVSDPFLRYGAKLILTGYDAKEIREMLENFTESIYERGMAKSDILKTMAKVAPAFGMIGTLVGLIIMLDNMGTDPSGLGGGLALALLTTLYGLLCSQLIFKPGALKLAQKESMLRHRNHMLVEGFVLLSERKNPIYIEDSLNSFLDPQHHFQIAKDRTYY